MSTAKRLQRIRILGLCPSRDSVALMRRALFACGEVELLGSSAQVEDALARAAVLLPDLVLVALDHQLDIPALANGLAALGGIPFAGLREGAGPTRTAVRRDSTGLPVLTTPLALEQLTTLVAAGTRRPAAAGANSARVGYVDRLIARSKGFVQLVPAVEIVWIEALHNAVMLHTLHGETRLRIPISRLEPELPPERFVRIHRSHAVNLEHVTQFRVSPQGQYSAVTPAGIVLNVGRTYQSSLMLRLQRF